MQAREGGRVKRRYDAAALMTVLAGSFLALATMMALLFLRDVPLGADADAQGAYLAANAAVLANAELFILFGVVLVIPGTAILRGQAGEGRGAILPALLVGAGLTVSGLGLLLFGQRSAVTSGAGAIEPALGYTLALLGVALVAAVARFVLASLTRTRWIDIGALIAILAATAVAWAGALLGWLVPGARLVALYGTSGLLALGLLAIAPSIILARGARRLEAPERGVAPTAASAEAEKPGKPGKPGSIQAAQWTFLILGTLEVLAFVAALFGGGLGTETPEGIPAAVPQPAAFALAALVSVATVVSGIGLFRNSGWAYPLGMATGLAGAGYSALLGQASGVFIYLGCAGLLLFGRAFVRGAVGGGAGR